MTHYTAPIRDMNFILDDVLKIDSYSHIEGFDAVDAETRMQMMEASGRFISEVVAPLNSVGDQEGCTRHPDGSVSTPTGFKEAYQQMVASGALLAAAPEEMGGLGLPHIINAPANEMSSAANTAFSMIAGLTHGAFSALMEGGSEALKSKYGPKLASGEWAGTMNLTEPQCGTDLGLIKTKAADQGDGSYKITGSKIWISGGEQDMTDNIVHLVLARMEGAPEGIKGISLFLVPKFLVNEDGSLGERNAVVCGGLEEKMGIHGNPTCVMNYDGATGWLVGEPHKGMRTMFVMMNRARLDVGLQGLAAAEVAYQNALAFAKERRQGRSLSGPAEPDKPADCILVHPDVRRMMLDVRCFVEGARAFTYWVTLFADLEHRAPDEETRQKAGDFMGLLTPVAKSFMTHHGYQAANDALQVLGGSGFTRDYGLEQIVRDARISMIYEGTNGIQALDLVGRKLASNGGRGIFSWFAELEDFINAESDNAEMAPYIDGLKDSHASLKKATDWLMEHGMTDFNNAAAVSNDYLNIFGYSAFALMWAKMAKVSLEKIAEGSNDPFYDDKLVLARYYVTRVLPNMHAHMTKLSKGAEPIMELAQDRF